MDLKSRYTGFSRKFSKFSTLYYGSVRSPRRYLLVSIRDFKHLSFLRGLQRVLKGSTRFLRVEESFDRELETELERKLETELKI